MIRYPAARSWAAAGVLLAVSLAVCMIFVNSYPLPGLTSDDVEYMALARSVAVGTGFSQDGVNPTVYRPPLFSVLLGGWFRLTGTSSVLSAAAFQSILHALGVVAAFLLFLEISVSLSWALAGGLFLAVNPLLVTRVVFVLQEPTLILVTTLAVLASVRLVRSSSPGRAATAGAAWGVATLAKAVAWFAPFLLLAMRLLPARLRWSWRGKEAALLLFCFAAVIAPWTCSFYTAAGSGGKGRRRATWASWFCFTGCTGSNMRLSGATPASAWRSTRCSWRWCFPSTGPRTSRLQVDWARGASQIDLCEGEPRGNPDRLVALAVFRAPAVGVWCQGIQVGDQVGLPHHPGV